MAMLQFSHSFHVVPPLRLILLMKNSEHPSDVLTKSAPEPKSSNSAWRNRELHNLLDKEKRKPFISFKGNPYALIHV